MTVFLNFRLFLQMKILVFLKKVLCSKMNMQHTSRAKKYRSLWIMTWFDLQNKNSYDILSNTQRLLFFIINGNKSRIKHFRLLGAQVELKKWNQMSAVKKNCICDSAFNFFFFFGKILKVQSPSYCVLQNLLSFNFQQNFCFCFNLQKFTQNN